MNKETEQLILAELLARITSLVSNDEPMDGDATADFSLMFRSELDKLMGND